MFDSLDNEEAIDLVERLEKMQLERDKTMMGLLAKLLENMTIVLGQGLGIEFPGITSGSKVPVNERGEIDWYGGKGGE